MQIIVCSVLEKVCFRNCDSVNNWEKLYYTVALIRDLIRSLHLLFNHILLNLWSKLFVFSCRCLTDIVTVSYCAEGVKITGLECWIYWHLFFFLSVYFWPFGFTDGSNEDLTGNRLRGGRGSDMQQRARGWDSTQVRCSEDKISVHGMLLYQLS